jgi:bacillithiol biosynthesis deacetylase BshB1
MSLDILAFGAHPDDVELFAGGTLAKMAAAGYRTGIVDMTRGELGTRGTAAVRSREARAAARILGIHVRENLGLPDGNVQVDGASRLKVIRVLRRHRPTIVMVHHWDDRHPDHVNTSRLVTEAAHHAGLAKIRTGQRRFRPDAILYFMLPSYQRPSFIVDVSDFADVRTEAIRAYRSQLFDPASEDPPTYLSRPDFVDQIEAIHAYFGTLIGRRKGEGFYIKGVIEIADPVDFIRRQSGLRFRY